MSDAHPFAPTTSKDGLAELATEIINAVTDLADVNALDRALPDVMERLRSHTRTTDAELKRLREALADGTHTLQNILDYSSLSHASHAEISATLAKMYAALDTSGEGEG